MKRVILIVFVSVLLVTGAVHLEQALVSFTDSLFWQLLPTPVTGHEPPVSEPSVPQPASPTPDPVPEPTPKNCAYCNNSHQCQNCEGIGIEFGPRFGIYSGYGMDTLMDKVCFMCKGDGICRFCD